jgi:hypothetical protein
MINRHGRGPRRRARGADGSARGRLEAGAERRAELALFVVATLGVVRVEPDAGPKAKAQPDRAHQPSRPFEIEARTRPDYQARTELAFASKG